MDSDPFVTDVLHVLSRYSETAKDALAGDVLEVPNGGALPKDEAQEEALRQKSAEDELLVRRALDRFRAMAAAEQKRWKTGSGELLQIYVAARRQELEVAKRCFADGELKARFTQQVTDRVNQHLVPLTKKTPQPAHRETKDVEAQKAWAGEVSRAIISQVRQEWRGGQRQLLQRLAQDMREAQQTTAEVLERHLAASGASQAQATELWRQRAEELRKRLGRLVEAYRLALMAMRQAELDEVKQHNSQQGQFFQREIQQMAKADEEAQQRAGKIKKLKQALGKWQRQYLADALSQAAEREAMSAPSEMCDLQELAADAWFSEELPQLSAAANAEAAEVAETGEEEAVAAEALGRLCGEALASRLEACGIVMDHLWESSEEDAWNFLHGLEEEVPASTEAIQLYEQFLSAHGVLCPLGGPLVTSALLQEAETAQREAERAPATAKKGPPKSWK